MDYAYSKCRQLVDMSKRFRVREIADKRLLNPLVDPRRRLDPDELRIRDIPARVLEPNRFICGCNAPVTRENGEHNAFRPKLRAPYHEFLSWLACLWRVSVETEPRAIQPGPHSQAPWTSTCCPR